MSVKVVNSGPGVIEVSVETTPAITVTSPDVSPVEVTAGLQGETGPQGATGPQGPAGADGADGEGVIAGGVEGQVLFKASGTDYDTTWDYVESLYLQVENAEATSLSAGTVVYAFGVSGSNITVKKADASTSSTMPAIGFVLEEITAGSTGEIITSGLFNKTISGLSGISVGDTVYVSETAGEVTTTKPTGTALIQNVGVVLKTNGTNIQKMKVSAIDRVNDIPNLPEGYIWAGDSSGVATATNVAYVDIANSRIGVGTTSPTSNLHVVGSTHAQGALKSSFGLETTSADMALLNSLNATGFIRFMTTTGGVGTERMRIINNGNVGIGTTTPGEKLHVIGQIKIDDGANPYTFPAADGSANQFLKTDGSGSVGFASITEATGNELENVVEDLTPQLGGDLDVNGNKITSASAGNILIEPDSTGEIQLSATDITFPDNDHGIQFEINPLNLTIKSSVLGNIIRFLSNSNKIDVHQPLALGGHSNVSTERLGIKIPAGFTALVVEDSSNAEKFKIAADGSGNISTTIHDNLTITDGVNPYTFPAADGSADQVLKTDGSGSVEFASITQATGNELENVVEDTTPQLGGDLDVNGNKITSASNGDITIQPNGTGAIILKSDDIQFDGGGTFGGQIKLYESDILGSNYIALKAPLSLANNVTYELPAADGTVGQVLTTTATGSLEWDTVLTPDNPVVNGLLTIEEGTTSAAKIAMYDLDGSNYIRLDAPDVISSNVTFVLPAADGSANQVLKTDGSGNLSFVDQASGTVDTTGTPADNQLSVFTDADTIEGDSNLTWNGSRLAVVGELAADSVIIDENGLSSAGDFGAGSRILSRIGTNTTGATVGDVYYLSGTWAQADADAVSTASGLLGVTTDASTDNGVLVSGVVKVADNTGFSSSTEGTVLYLDTTAGHVTATAPSATGDVVRVVGYVLDGTNGIIYFDPSKDWIELS